MTFSSYWEGHFFPTDELHHFSEGYTINQLMFIIQQQFFYALSPASGVHQLDIFDTLERVMLRDR